MDNPKVKLVKNHKFGKALFAKESIKKGEIIAEFDGEIYTAKKASMLPPLVRNHVIQFSKTKYKYAKGLAQYANHSCNPNCGIKDLFKIIAMKNIAKGEEITWDYEMSEDSDWKMDCECGSENCRKTIGNYKNLPSKIKQKYKGYISEWLLK